MRRDGGGGMVSRVRLGTGRLWLESWRDFHWRRRIAGRGLARADYRARYAIVRVSGRDEYPCMSDLG